MKRNTIFKWLVPIVLVVSVLALFISRQFAGGAALFSRSLNDDAFALLGLVNANSSADNPSPVLGSIASFASDSTALIQAVEAKDSARAADLVWHLETDRAVVNKALAAHPDALPAEEWAAAQHKLDVIAKRIPPMPTHMAEASKPIQKEVPPAPAETPKFGAAAGSAPLRSPGREGETPTKVSEETRIGAYVVRLKPDPHQVEILRNGKRLYSITVPGALGDITIGAKQALREVGAAESLEEIEAKDQGTPRQIGLGQDITGSGQPDLVVTTYSGGAHCCTTLYIFEIGKHFRLITTVEEGNGEFDRPFFLKIRGVEGLAIWALDNAFAYWAGDFVSSPFMSVILTYQRGGYHLAKDIMMRQPVPSPAKLKEIAEKIRKSQNWRTLGMVDTIHADSEIWQEILYLLYTGHADLGREFLDWAWPSAEGKPSQVLSKAVVEREFCARLYQSPYWPEVKEINYGQRRQDFCDPPPSEAWLITGDKTRLRDPQSIALDAQDNIYVADGARILVYRAGSHGNVAPNMMIAGTRTELSKAKVVAVDGSGNIYVLDQGDLETDKPANTILIYRAGSDGNVAPLAKIKGDAPGIAVDSQDNLISVDSALKTPLCRQQHRHCRDYNLNLEPAAGETRPIAADAHNIYVLSDDDKPGVTIYPNVIAHPKSPGKLDGATADIVDLEPTATIGGERTGLKEPSGIAVDGLGNIYVTDGSDDPGGGSVVIYAGGSHGNVAPLATIKGDRTELDSPAGVAVDARGNIYVVDSKVEAILVYGAGSNADVSPRRASR